MLFLDKFPQPLIIYEDQCFLVLDKPPGLLVHPTKYQKSNTLVDWLVQKYPEIKSIGSEQRPGIVHRLDKEVSGLMVIARTEQYFAHLIDQFKRKKVRKDYTALVWGHPPQDKGIIDLPWGRTTEGKIVAVKYRKGIKQEKEARTEYETIESFGQYTLLKVSPLTGRTHQIRVHLKAINCPIVGDAKYGKKQGPDRIFLHASYLSFYDLTGRKREFTSQLPDKLKQFLDSLSQER